MNEKITIQDLIDILAEKHSMNKKDAELFVKGVFELVEEALATEKYVKVKGLGTFKLIGVDSRESVDVNTGERIEIQGHNKVSFTPESSLKDLINKPFAHFETVIINEGVNLDEGQPQVENDMENVEPVEEPVSVAATVVETVEEPEVESVKDVIEEPSKDDVAEEVVVAVEEFVEESVGKEPIEEQIEEVVEEVVDEIIEESADDSVKISVPDVIEEMNDTPEEKEEEKTSKMWIVVTIILFIIILAGLYWLFRPSESVVVSAVADEVTVVVDTVAVKENETNEVQDSVQKVVVDEQPVVMQEKVASLSDTTEYRIVGTKTTYTLEDGETLIRASLKFYGSKNFWPYIAKHNEKNIKNVNNVPKGTKLLIPELERK